MNKSLKQSLKDRLKIVAKERSLTFEEVWHNLVLERFLVRLCESKFKSNFVLKGGTLLARYIKIDRETKDLDFLARKLNNDVEYFKTVFEDICRIDLKDNFEFEMVKIGALSHPHMNYSGIEVLLSAKLGSGRSTIQIDIAFGDIVEDIPCSMDLTSSSKGPIFESRVQVQAYPEEFIFAEKLETVVRRGIGNTRMKDFHDLYSLISSKKALDRKYTEKVVTAVFHHRQTPAIALPLQFDDDGLTTLQNEWKRYYASTFSPEVKTDAPREISKLIELLNNWLRVFTCLCIPLEQTTIKTVYLPLNPSKSLYPSRLIDLSLSQFQTIHETEEHLLEPLNFNRVSGKWEARYEHDKVYEVVLFYVHGDSGRGFSTHNARDLNRTQTHIKKASLGEIFRVPGYFLNDWNNRIHSSGELYYWFQPLDHLSTKARKTIIDAAKKKLPYNTFG